MYRLTSILLVALALTGCGFDKREMHYHYVFEVRDGCPLREFRSEAPLDMFRTGIRFRVAQGVLVRGGVFKSNQEWCEWMKDLRIDVSDSGLVGPNAMGWYDNVNGIKLSHTLGALTHEILHSVNVAHFQPGTAWHEGWDEVRDGNTASYNQMDHDGWVLAQDDISKNEPDAYDLNAQIVEAP